MNKTLYLISNAHLDPVWQWEWEEGAAAAVSTFRTAARFCRERDGYIFCHNEAVLYEWVNEYEPELFEEVRRLVDEGRWIIVGGWYIQPDCNMPSGETFIRHAVYGRRYFYEKFGVKPDIATSFDAFGHTRGLVQILSKTGYKYYIHCRPGQLNMPNTYKWIGYDGSMVIGERQPEGYGSGLGWAAGKAEGKLNSMRDGERGICLWGVGDHGGGASEIDLDKLDELMVKAAKDGDIVRHADPEEYFRGIDPDTLPEWKDGINPWAVGCYTSQAVLKAQFRALEDAYYSIEKMCMLARPMVAFPREKLQDALKAMLFATFHDYLPGSSVEPVEAMGRRQLGGALDSLTKLRAAAFFSMCRGQKQARPDEIPVFVFNPHPYPVEDVFECEFMLWDQGWSDVYKYPRLFTEDGTEVPSQPEKELSNIPIDWRKRIAFRVKAAPASVTRLNCRFDDRKKLPVEQLPTENGEFVFENGMMRATISRSTGLLSSYKVGGRELLSGCAFRLDVIADNCDSWGMTVESYRNMIGSFRLVSDEETGKFSAIDHPIPAVRVIENGSVRVVVEAVFAYGISRAYVRYALSRSSTDIDVSVRLHMNEIEKMIKLTIPCEGLKSVAGQTAYGREPLSMDGSETVSQRYRIMDLGDNAMLIRGLSTYGSSVEGNEFKISLLRTPAFTGHPLGDRRVLPDDRYMPHMDMVNQVFEFRLTGGDRDVIFDRAERLTQTYCEKPFCMSFFPPGEGEKPEVQLSLEGDNCITLAAYKESEYGERDIVRLFNPTGIERNATLNHNGHGYSITLKPYSFETYLINGGVIEAVSADETEKY